MTRTRIEKELNGLYADLENLERIDEATACEVYSVDCKDDIIECINEEIKFYEKELEELEALYAEDEDDGMDYVSLQQSQGLPVIVW